MNRFILNYLGVFFILLSILSFFNIIYSYYFNLYLNIDAYLYTFIISAIIGVSSFIKNGHEYHLYTYSDIKNVPEGTIIKDGNEILPEDSIFTYKYGEGRGSVSAFSNVFRYKLLFDKGGYWVDTDVVCLNKWNFENHDYVFASEEDSDKINNPENRKLFYIA